MHGDQKKSSVMHGTTKKHCEIFNKKVCENFNTKKFVKKFTKKVCEKNNIKPGYNV